MFTILFATAFASGKGPMLLKMKQLCHELQISEASARRYSRTQPDFPAKIVLGPRRTAYRREDVERYIASRAGQSST